LLGHRLAQIAMEKAGIVKPGRPAVSGARGREACREIERICRERSAPLRRLGEEIHYRYVPGRITSEGIRLPRVHLSTDRHAWPEMELGLLGEHQAANAAVAVAAVEHLRDEGFRIADDAVAQGLAGVRWPARLEVVDRRPMVILDCAHNVASAQALVDTLATTFPDFGPGAAPPGLRRRRLLLFGGSSDKDLAGMLRILAPAFDHLYLTRYANNARSVSPDQVAAILRTVADVPFSTNYDSAEAWITARNQARADDLICITGSVFLAGELRPLLHQAGSYRVPPGQCATNEPRP
jgi:dihydrofolate synthase/folylpolyglutamate synthase